MPKLFSKKIFFFSVIILLVCILLPGIVHAWDWPWNWAEDAKNEIANAIINGIIMLCLSIPLSIITVCSTVSFGVLSAAISFATEGTSYTNSQAVQLGWPIVRNLANMMIVLGFVVIGVATALRYREYEAKQLLVKLIIAALLVNFSIMLCGIVIDGTNIIMKYFFVPAGLSTLDNWMPAVGDVKYLMGQIGGLPISQFAPLLFGLMFFYFLAFFAYLLYAALILGRVVALQMLVILSPLAFVCSVFPHTRNVWQQWYKNFTQWCIIVLPAGLFYYIGLSMIHKPGAIDLGITDWKQYVTGVVSTTLIPGMFLIVGFMASLQFSAMGASSILNFANKNKGKALSGGLSALRKTTGAVAGAIGGTAAGQKYSQMADSLQGSTNKNALVRGLAKTAGAVMNAPKSATSAVVNSADRTQAMKDMFSRGLERVGGIPEGTAQGNQNAARAKEAASLKNIQSNARLATIAEAGGVKGAAAAEILMDRGAWGNVNGSKRDQVAQNAIKHGVSRDVFTKSKPETLSTPTDKEAKSELLVDAAKAHVAAHGGNMDDALKAVTPTHAPTDTEIRTKKKDMEARRQTEQALGLAPTTDRDVVNKMTDDQIKAHIAGGSTREEALAAVANYKPTAGEIAGNREDVSKERINKGFEKLGDSGITSLPDKALSTAEFGMNVGYAALARALPRLSGDKSAEAQKLIDPSNKDNLKKKLVAELGGRFSESSPVGDIKAEIDILRKSSAKADQDKAKKINDLANKYILLADHFNG